MAIGDLLFSLMGQPNPGQQISQALGQFPGQAGSRSGPVPGPGAGAAAPGLAQAGGGANSQGAPPSGQPPPPPQPQAYQTPPDMGQLYLNLMQRQQANQGINTGLGLLAGAFSHNQADRDNMIGAMSDLNKNMPSPGEQMSSIASLQQTMWQRQMLMQQLQMAPVYAKQLGISVEQATAYIQSGKLPEIMEAVTKQKMEQADPLHIAQTREATAATGKATAETGAIPAQIAKTEADTAEATARTGAIPAQVAKTTAETAAIPSTVAKTTAETAAIPSQVAKTTAETAAIPAQVAKTTAETAAIPAQVAKTTAETSLTQAQAEKAQADAAARANLNKLIQDSATFTAGHGIYSRNRLMMLPGSIGRNYGGSAPKVQPRYPLPRLAALRTWRQQDLVFLLLILRREKPWIWLTRLRIARIWAIELERGVYCRLSRDRIMRRCKGR